MSEENQSKRDLFILSVCFRSFPAAFYLSNWAALLDVKKKKKKRYSFMSVFKQEARIHTLASVSCHPDKVDLIEFRGAVVI